MGLNLTTVTSLNTFHFDYSGLLARSKTEPPIDSMKPSPPLVPTSFMDDTYHVSHGKGHGGNLTSSTNLVQTRAPAFDAQQFLVIRFGLSQRHNWTDDATLKEELSRVNTLSEPKGLQNEVPVNQKRSMGNPPEDRPRKKQKFDHIENQDERKLEAVKEEKGHRIVIDLTGGMMNHSVAS